LLFGGIISIFLSQNLKLLLITIPAILASIAHFLKLPKDTIKVSRKTNQMSAIHLLASIMIIIYFIL
jgi:2C-methyl-D-erythritol 2,4-cyclodiphosphate synthase